MAVLGINSRAASPFKKVDFTVAWVKMAKTFRARIDAENDHRRVTRPRLRIIVKEIRGAIQRAIYELHPIRFNTVPSRAKLVTKLHFF